MALLLAKIYDSFQYFCGPGDYRTEKFVAKSPLSLIGLLAVYVLFSIHLGPKWMKDRKPVNLRSVLLVYNALQVIVNSYLSIKGFIIIFKFDITCSEIDMSNTPENLNIIHLGQAYFYLKLCDLLDTVFFVLKKNNGQISFLHVYHHTMIILVSWYGLKYMPGGHSSYLPIVNSFVHVVMYSYYFMTAYDRDFKKHLGWKKKLTQLQLVQFVLLLIVYLLPLLNPNCGFPKYVIYLLLTQNFIMIIMFGDFYYKVYIKQKKNRTK